MKGRAVRRSRIRAIVPVNLVKKSKTRLSPMLSPAEREQLTVGMLTDVLHALGEAACISDITVVSADKKIPAIARRYGAQFLWEGNRRGLNRALRLAIRTVEQSGDGAVLIIHADLPLLTVHDIETFIVRSQGFQLAIAPCKEDLGTNALLLRPPDIFPLSFGNRSFKKHLSQAQKMKLRYKVVRLRGLQFDIDEPRDLRQLLHRRVRNETQHFLSTLRSRNRV
jgi:2-phospho-L-lactate guanylyltransferase